MKKLLSILLVAVLFSLTASIGYASFIFAEPEPTPEIELTKEERIVYDILHSLKMSMKNPASFKVYSGQFLNHGTIGKMTSTPSQLYLVLVDVSAENGFGGTVRNTWLIAYHEMDGKNTDMEYYCTTDSTQSKYGSQNNSAGYLNMMETGANKVIELNAANLNDLLSR